MEKRREELLEIRQRQRRNDAESWQWRLTFCGQRMGHNYYLYYLIDQVFAHHPGIEGIVEIGTGHGAMTIVLGLWGAKRGIPVLSIDKNAGLHDRWLLSRLNVAFYQHDEFGKDAQWIIAKVLRDRRVFLVCDGGNKPKEFQMWAPEILPGSVIAVHDWGVEIGPEDVDGYVEECGLVPFLPKKWEHMNVQFAMWSKP